MLAAILTGCGTETAAPAASESGTSPAESSVSSPAAGSASDSSVSEEREESGQNGSEQDVTGLELEVTEGTLYIRAGDSVSLTRHGGEPLDYEIEDGVLSFSDSRGGDIVLTLPENSSYDSLRLTVKNGHVYAEDALTLRSLELTMDRGEAKLEQAAVSESSTIDVDQGSAFLSGDLGQSISASCREGHLSLEVSFERSGCNYEIDLSQGNIRLGSDHYSGRSYSKTLDNGAERTMRLSCARGDVSVEFEGETGD